MKKFDLFHRRKPVKSLNSPLYSPLRNKEGKEGKDENGTFTTQLDSNSLVSRQPCLNGYTNTMDNIGSNQMKSGNFEEKPQNNDVNRTGKPSLLIPKMSKFNNEKEVMMSPGLKSALNKSSSDRGKQISVFKKNNIQNSEEKKAEEEKN